MAQLLRIMANLMRPDTLGPAEVGFKAMTALAGCPPDRRRSWLTCSAAELLSSAGGPSPGPLDSYSGSSYYGMISV
jgi:hypothetical protein